MPAITVGFIWNVRIFELVLEACSYKGCAEFAYITRLDSGDGFYTTDWLLPLLEGGGMPCEIKQGGLLFRTADVEVVLTAFKDHFHFPLFVGWDECWFLNSASGADVPQNEIRLTSETPIIDFTPGRPEPIYGATLEKAVSWGIAAEAELCLGDGTGLNYIAFTPAAQKFMRRVESYYQ